MKLFVCAVYDSSLQAHTRPIFVPSTGIAVRSFSDEVNRQAPAAENPMFAHPEDFELHLLGTWDEESGRFENGETRCIARGKDVRSAS